MPPQYETYQVEIAPGAHMESELTLQEALIGAAEAPPGRRIQFRDPVARYGAEAVAALVPWLQDPELAAFAVRAIARAASFGAEVEAVRALQAALRQPISPVIKGDLEVALQSLGKRPSGASAGRTRPVRQKPSEPVIDLVVGRVYRRRDLHDSGWGGNQQMGISYPAGGDYVLLFSDPDSASEHGYRDRWVGDVYYFYGHWSGTGDMAWTPANRVVLDRSPYLHLFIAARGGHRYEGQFECLGHESETTVRDGREFRAIVFLLRRVLT